MRLPSFVEATLPPSRANIVIGQPPTPTGSPPRRRDRRPTGWGHPRSLDHSSHLLAPLAAEVDGREADLREGRSSPARCGPPGARSWRRDRRRTSARAACGAARRGSRPPPSCTLQAASRPAGPPAGSLPDVGVPLERRPTPTGRRTPCRVEPSCGPLSPPRRSRSVWLNSRGPDDQHGEPDGPRVACGPGRGTSGRRRGRSGCLRSSSSSCSPNSARRRSPPRSPKRSSLTGASACTRQRPARHEGGEGGSRLRGTARAARPRSARPEARASRRAATRSGPPRSRSEVAQHANIRRDQRGEAGDGGRARRQHRGAGRRVGPLDRPRRARRRRSRSWR